MSLDEIASGAQWGRRVDQFFETVDDLPHHFLMHLLHGAEILAYKHPEACFRGAWWHFYLTGVTDLHLSVETEQQLDARLNDWFGRDDIDGAAALAVP